jgi:uncharacterized protein
VQLRAGRLWFSPSDLTVYLGCVHATTLHRDVALERRARPHRHSAYGALVAAKGALHEREYRDALLARGRSVVEVDHRALGWEAAARATRDAMQAGADVVYQATFVGDGWRGVADFVERVATPSALGDWSYEAVDTKLARSDALPHHVVQLCFYTQAIDAIQGCEPGSMHVLLGSGRTVTMRPRDVAAYYRRARQGFEAFVRGGAETRPFRVDHCTYCDFRAACEARWAEEDHLGGVAGVRRDQIERLEAAGITTLAALAALPLDRRVPRVRDDSLAALREQASLQLEARQRGGLPPFVVLPVEEHRGFNRLPQPSPGDVMFDIEGDPFWTPAEDLTFLFGLLLREGEGWTYRGLWAHDRERERAAFEELVGVLHERLARYPDMHVYHYSPAETTVLKQLMARHGTREHEIDDLLRRQVFVDVLGVLRQGVRIGVPSYGLKHVERLTGFSRDATISGGADAVLAYEEWRASGDEAELAGIASYNEEDCRATLAVRDWLLDVRPGAASWLAPIGRSERDEERREVQDDRARLRAALVDGAAEGSARWLAGELLEYHAREARPGWWRYFALLAMDDEELVEDGEALGDLAVTGAPLRDGKSLAYTLSFPGQQHKIGIGAYVDPHSEKSVTVTAIDDAAGVVTIRRGETRADEALPTALIPGKPYATTDQRAALARLATAVRDDSARFVAARSMLSRELPRIAGRGAGSLLQTTDLAAQKDLAAGLDLSYLVVQGPPGTGKTYTGARIVVELIRRGHRVGVTALSHKAINNLLAEVERAAAEVGVSFAGARKASTDNPESRFDGQLVKSVTRHADCLDPAYRLVAGTSWLFAREDWDDQLDHLVIDEAGQYSLADALAAGTAARNLVLLGDPLQLPQVSQALHPVGTNASVLEHLLAGADTVPPERGIFLEQSWRMHPDVCGFISQEVYESRLTAHPSCERQTTGAGTGIRYLPVEHAGNGSSSPEEGECIADEVQRLIGIGYVDQRGAARPLDVGDIMVVAPYNAQVRLLQQMLPAGVRVGTVDKFQGQEAPIVFFSMATSSGEDAPRNVAFLFSRNRLNVAISRARCLAYLVCAPALLSSRVRTIEDMRLVNTLCALADAAESPQPHCTAA